MRAAWEVVKKVKASGGGHYGNPHPNPSPPDHLTAQKGSPYIQASAPIMHRHQTRPTVPGGSKSRNLDPALCHSIPLPPQSQEQRSQSEARLSLYLWKFTYLSRSKKPFSASGTSLSSTERHSCLLSSRSPCSSYLYTCLIPHHQILSCLPCGITSLHKSPQPSQESPVHRIEEMSAK